MEETDSKTGMIRKKEEQLNLSFIMEETDSKTGITLKKEKQLNLIDDFTLRDFSQDVVDTKKEPISEPSDDDDFEEIDDAKVETEEEDSRKRSRNGKGDAAKSETKDEPNSVSKDDKEMDFHEASLDDKAQDHPKRRQRCDKCGATKVKSDRKADVVSEEWRRFTRDLPCQEPQKRTTFKQRLAPSVHATSHKIGNLCLFACVECGQSPFASYSGLTSHRQRFHRGRPFLFSPGSVIEARYHKCLVCQKLVLCDNKFIAYHAKGHRMKYSDYAELVVRRGGQVF